jgi:hypothetical protein
MSRTDRQLLKLENMLSLAKKQQKERQQKDYQIYVLKARPHATAVAAIVLAGKPKIDEPLSEAWKRALLHYKIDNRYHWNHVNAANQLFPLIVGHADVSAKFSEIFKTAPAWLLTFTAMHFDAGALKFKLPHQALGNLKWGREGYEESLNWPSIPSGRITDGDPVKDVLWPAPPKKAGSLEVVERDPAQEEKDNPELLDDIMLLFEVEENPEKEKNLSRYERIRLNNLQQSKRKENR